jgi:hypothetical protein
VGAVTGLLVDLGAVQTGTGIVVAQDPAPPPGQGEEFGKASPIALVVVILLALATVVLVRSMSKRIRRLPASFDHDAEQAPDADGSASARPADRDAEDAGGSRS